MSGTNKTEKIKDKKIRSVDPVIREGGKAPNMVPDMASCEIYIRSLDWTYLEELTCLIQPFQRELLQVP